MHSRIPAPDSPKRAVIPANFDRNREAGEPAESREETYEDEPQITRFEMPNGILNTAVGVGAIPSMLVINFLKGMYPDAPITEGVIVVAFVISVALVLAGQVKNNRKLKLLGIRLLYSAVGGIVLGSLTFSVHSMGQSMNPHIPPVK